MTQKQRRAVHDLADLCLLFAALVVAYTLRFDARVPTEHLGYAVQAAPYVILLQYLCLVAIGVPRFAWRFVGFREVSRILAAISLSTSILLFVRFVIPAIATSIPVYPVLPLGVIVVNGVLAFLFITGVRAIGRGLVETRTRRRRKAKRGQTTPALLIGAGDAGVMVAREMIARPELGMRPIGFVDDDPLKRGQEIEGLPIFGSSTEIATIAAEHDVRRAIISISNVSGSTVRRLKALCEEANLKPQIIPCLHEILSEQVDVVRIRDVSIEDLLRRDIISLREPEALGTYADRKVLVTGAGGSIGSEICRQIARLGPSKLILAERSEPSLFQIHRELTLAGFECEIIPVLVDVCNEERVRQVFTRHEPEVVFHAAAHKHVPMVEANVSEAVRNNTFGTCVVANAAHDLGVESFVLISTDKAVNPSSVMGGTKRLAEMYVQAMSQRSETRFMAVRFGNVVDSAGSVLPIFREQIARGGPVTVTHPEMTRYFLTIPEATQLVLQAGAMGKGGEVFILDMGEPVRIADLATDLVRLSGLEPGEDIQIEFTGMRPGEKLFEELAFDPENMGRTENKKVFVAKLIPIRYEYMDTSLRLLRSVLYESDDDDIRNLLQSLIPEMRAAVKSKRTEAPSVLRLVDEGEASLRDSDAGDTEEKKAGEKELIAS